MSRTVGVHKLLLLNFYPFLQAGRGPAGRLGTGPCRAWPARPGTEELTPLALATTHPSVSAAEPFSTPPSTALPDGLQKYINPSQRDVTVILAALVQVGRAGSRDAPSNPLQAASARRRQHMDCCLSTTWMHRCRSLQAGSPWAGQQAVQGATAGVPPCRPAMSWCPPRLWPRCCASWWISLFTTGGAAGCAGSPFLLAAGMGMRKSSMRPLVDRLVHSRQVLTRAASVPGGKGSMLPGAGRW